MTISAPIQTERARSSTRKVTFEDDEMDRCRGQQMTRPNLARVGSDQTITFITGLRPMTQRSFSGSSGDYRNYPRQDARSVTRNISRSPGIRGRGAYRGAYKGNPNETVSFAPLIEFEQQRQY